MGAEYTKLTDIRPFLDGALPTFDSGLFRGAGNDTVALLNAADQLATTTVYSLETAATTYGRAATTYAC